jgi:hypothetical protein
MAGPTETNVIVITRTAKSPGDARQTHATGKRSRQDKFCRLAGNAGCYHERLKRGAVPGLGGQRTDHVVTPLDQ